MITTSGGQHGQESEEGEEGEERSEEDCEEDEEGCEEEEVTRLEENAGDLTPATSQEPSSQFAFRSEFQTGGSGRRKRVSARHQVKRLDRYFEWVRPPQNRSGRRNKFSSFVRIFDPRFTGGFRYREIWS